MRWYVSTTITLKRNEIPSCSNMSALQNTNECSKSINVIYATIGYKYFAKININVYISSTYYFILLYNTFFL